MANYHFIAIGGVGMSGLAKYLIEEGNVVSGSDIQESKYIDALRTLGATIFIGHDSKNLQDDAIVIVSSAIKDDNPELIKAKQLGLKIYHRSDLLEEIAKSAQKKDKIFIGFSGTHGKTTTSGLASYVLENAGMHPSYVVGGIIPKIHTNAQFNDGKHFIAELDESDGTIVKYNPDILVVNNLEADHLDHYKNGLSDLIKTFDEIVSKSKKVLVNNDDEGVRQLSGNFITFGLKEADYIASNVISNKNGTTFDVVYKGTKLVTVSTILSGLHNVYNNLSVVAALNESGIDVKTLVNEFSTFTGMGRRFQKICDVEGITIYDDYAHHPTEIMATLDSASAKFDKEHIIAVFQPHRYSRLKSLWNLFKSSFNKAGRVIVTDVYAASENYIDGITAENFSKELSGSEYVSGNIESVARYLAPTLKKGDVVIGLGAGTITSLGKELKKCIEENYLVS